MNICFYGYAIQDIACGSATYFTLLAEKMLELGHTVTIASSGKKRHDLPKQISFISLNKGNTKFQKFIVFPAKSLLLFLNKQYELIHAGSSYSRFAYLAKLVSILSGTPMIYTVFSERSLPGSMDFDGIIFISKRLKNMYCNKKGIYVPPFINLNQFDFTGRYNFGKSYDFVVGTLGTPFPRRGHIFLIEAIPIVLKKYPNTLFVLAIAPPQIRRREERAAKKEFNTIQRIIRKYNNNVRILGGVNVPKFLNSIDVLVYPLQTAVGAMDIPPTILECLRAGCCLITTKVGAMTEVIKDGYNGILVDVQERDNPNIYADKIIQLIENKELYLNIRKNARNNLKQFDINEVVYRILSLYEEIKQKSFCYK